LTKQTKKIAFRIALTTLALAAVFAAATAFSEPASDPTTAGFRSPCAHALSKDDNCTYSRATDSLEAIAEAVDSL